MKAIIKLILGWALIVLSVTGIYGVGKLRQHLEYKFNNGNEFNFFFPNSVFGRPIVTPIDNSTFSVFANGLYTIFTTIFTIVFILAMSVIAYRIGEKLLDPIQEDDK